MQGEHHDEDGSRSAEKNMNDAKHKAAMDALNDLILSELQSGDRQRFASVKRLSVIAQRLLLQNNPTAEDVGVDGDEDVDGDEYGMVMPRRRRHVGNAVIMGAGADQHQQLREMLAMLGPAIGGLKNQSDARREESVARELNELLQARQELQGLERLPIQKRIDTILVAMGEETAKEGDEDGLLLVPTVDVRRHQVGAGLGGFDPAGRDRPFPYGEGRDPRAVEEGREARAASETMGDPATAVVPRSGLDQGAGGHAGGANLQGAGRAPEEPEAPPEAGVGGAVHERPGRAGDGSHAANHRRGCGDGHCLVCGEPR
jgi:hypothetical protein